MTIALIIAALIGGYVACIYTWPPLRTFFLGITTEAANLRIRAKALEEKLRGL